ncbi:hypothetical protein BHMPCIPO_03905 [Ensifer sesbaniae]|nr:hypothetical protein [Ensifer sesbaniae]
MDRVRRLERLRDRTALRSWFPRIGGAERAILCRHREKPAGSKANRSLDMANFANNVSKRETKKCGSPETT